MLQIVAMNNLVLQIVTSENLCSASILLNFGKIHFLLVIVSVVQHKFIFANAPPPLTHCGLKEGLDLKSNYTYHCGLD